MEEKLSGIVVGGISLGENDKILKIFTPEKGVISAKIKGVKKAGAKLKFASEPFCFAEFIFSSRGGLRTVIGASLIDSFYPIREDIIKYFCAGTVLELVKKFYKENMESTEGFLLTVEALKEFAYSDKDPKSALARYVVSVLRENGFALSFEGCYQCGCKDFGRVFFDYRRGAFFCEECFDGTGREINHSTMTALKEIADGKDAEKNFSDKVLRLLDYYIENRTEEKLNSLKELIKIL